MATTYLALLRGINVGGKNKLPMKELRELFAAAGCQDVRTYIQSGNVLFRASREVAAMLPDTIRAGIQERFGLRVPVVLRTVAEMEAVIRENPYPDEDAGSRHLHVVFLADRPDESRVAQLDPDRSPPDTFVVRGKEIYLHLPNGAAETKLTNAYFDAKLGTISTGRNWRTVNTLFGKMQG